MQHKPVTGDLVRLCYTSTHPGEGVLTGIVISVQDANTSSLGSAAKWYPHVYYVFFNDNRVRGPLFPAELVCL